MERLNRSLLHGAFRFPSNLTVHPYPQALPEQVIQFGEGNFLRAFVDWMFHRLNRQGLFNGRVVAVQPIPQGMCEIINQQDGLYTLLLRDVRDGTPTEVKEIISSISRCVTAYGQWDECLRCAQDPLIEYVVSNTTEAGIVFDEDDKLENRPPHTFPGKLTAYLYHRFQHFAADPAKGMVFIPCELIDRNGDNLRRTILQFAEHWRLPQTFSAWVKQHNVFLNTLVDRVVTGYPRDEIKEITAALGYEDLLVDAGELFHLWVIEGPKELAERLPFDKAGLHVIWTDDLAPHRTRKVRVLNGAHTSCAPAAFLYGVDTVGEMMSDDVTGSFVRQIIRDEIVPSMNLDRAMLMQYADDVIKRFQNPFIKHDLQSILLNSSSKFKTRVLPSLLEYRRSQSRFPRKLTFSLAALIAVYRGGTVTGDSMQACREIGGFIMKDDRWALEFFAGAWADYDGSAAAAKKLAVEVLQNVRLWGEDLNALDGFADAVAQSLRSITSGGIQRAMADLTRI